MEAQTLRTSSCSFCCCEELRFEPRWFVQPEYTWWWVKWSKSSEVSIEPFTGLLVRPDGRSSARHTLQHSEGIITFCLSGGCNNVIANTAAAEKTTQVCPVLLIILLLWGLHIYCYRPEAVTQHAGAIYHLWLKFPYCHYYYYCTTLVNSPTIQVTHTDALISNYCKHIVYDLTNRACWIN